MRITKTAKIVIVAAAVLVVAAASFQICWAIATDSEDMEMEELTLEAFTQQVRQMSDETRELPANESIKAHEELTRFIGLGTQALLLQGHTMTQIQEAVRDAMPQVDGHIPESIEPAEGDAEPAPLNLPTLQAVTILAPLEADIVDAFASGELGKEEFNKLLVGDEAAAFLVLEDLVLVLTDYEDDSSSPYAALEGSAGEIVVDENNDAYIPELLYAKTYDGMNSIFARPISYKTPQEVAGLNELLNEVSIADFHRRFRPGRLLKAKDITFYSRLFQPMEADEIAQVEQEYSQLKDLYAYAAEHKLGLAAYVVYYDGVAGEG